MNAITANTSPATARQVIRSGGWPRITTGLCAGHVQANLVVLPRDSATEFAEFCRANPKPLPLLEVADAPDRLRIAPGADLRTDLPKYHVHRSGEVSEVDDVWEVWRDDLVAFLLGCSFSAEERLLAAGVRLRHLDLGQGVPIFRTSLRCQEIGRFRGPLVVSMRAVRETEVARAVEVTGELPFAHGAPVHVGDPEAIGITDLARPDWGDALPLQDGEVPVFWACGVTPQAVLAEVRPELAITHAPAHMFLTDLQVADLIERGVEEA
ncbi:putative hydro-lyase [Saccharopolyspora hirsuta]|uniref:Putative hydro-lyase n=1 Tax=Saccharopolyspora hirsuta TaxID=1837 RepID=A0A5M7BPX7_SACHI|nr:putative hydro-lyase [Saccharopolyspora hirsuta]KAA5831862.1 putative hydro-lyase [Saccharopolyspora hirsuta]